MASYKVNRLKLIAAIEAKRQSVIDAESATYAKYGPLAQWKTKSIAEVKKFAASAIAEIRSGKGEHLEHHYLSIQSWPGAEARPTTLGNSHRNPLTPYDIALKVLRLSTEVEVALSDRNSDYGSLI